MGFRVIVFCFCYLAFATVQAVDVSLTHSWKENLGWEINCSWTIAANDSLQSVRLLQNDKEIQTFRPQFHGSVNHVRQAYQEYIVSTQCRSTDNKNRQGTCVVDLELLQPQSTDYKIACEVSGEGPYFNINRKYQLIEKFVEPTAAVVTAGLVNKETGLVILNCSAGGVPAPRLSWNIGDQAVPRVFSGTSRAWNATSKLWHAWSSLTYIPSDEHRSAVCTPESSSHGKTVRGQPAVYNAARNIEEGVFKMIIITVISLLLLR